MGNQGVSGNHNGSNGRASALSDFMLFAKNFVKHPNAVGWMLPSSPWVVNDVLKQD